MPGKLRLWTAAWTDLDGGRDVEPGLLESQAHPANAAEQIDGDRSAVADHAILPHEFAA